MSRKHMEKTPCSLDMLIFYIGNISTFPPLLMKHFPWSMCWGRPTKVSGLPFFSCSLHSLPCCCGVEPQSVTLRCLKTREENERCISFSLSVSLLRNQSLVLGALIHNFGLCNALDCHCFFSETWGCNTLLFTSVPADFCFIDHKFKKRQNRSHTKARKEIKGYELRPRWAIVH